jgi:hypothetical protein
MSTISEYNDNVRAINKNLQTVKRGGAVYEELIKKIGIVSEKLENAFYHYNQQKSELLKEKEKKDEFLMSLKKFLGDQNTKRKGINDAIEAYQNMGKNILASMKYKTLSSIKKHESVEALFRFLYINIYNEKSESFDYSKFVEVALKKDISDFQKRLAGFSVEKLDSENREKLSQIKAMDFSINQNNEDLYLLLEWLEFNYEAFLSVKEKEQLQKTIKETEDKEKKYAVQSQSSDLIIKDIDNLTHYAETHMNNLKIFKKKLEESNDKFRKGSHFSDLLSRMNSLFRHVDNFGGNQIVSSIDAQMN